MPAPVLTCVRCHKSKPEDAFWPWQQKRQNPYCIPCVKAADDEWLEEERKKHQTAQAARQGAPPALVELPGRRGRKKGRLVEHAPVKPLAGELEHQAGAQEPPVGNADTPPRQAKVYAWELVASVAEAAKPPVPDALEAAHLVNVDEAAATSASAADRPAPVNQWAAIGRARTPLKAERARENGKRGGRPRKWSREVLALVAGWIRKELEADATRRGEADLVPPAIMGVNERQELRHLAQALEEGKVR